MKDQPVNRGGIYARYFGKPEKPVAKPRVTKTLRQTVTKIEDTVTKPGRPKRYETTAERQRAYRERKKHG